MENIEIITLQRTRDFSRRINATFVFIKQNFRALIKSILYIAGPSVLLTSALLASMADDFFSVITSAVGNPDVINTYFFSVSFWIQMILIIILFFVSACVTLATINSFIILYDEKKTTRIEVNEVWDRVRKSFWMYAGSILLFMVLLFAVYAVMIFISMFVTLISPILFGLILFALYLGMFYFLVSSSLTFFIRAYEKKGFFESLARSFNLIRGKWWSTFGFAFVINLIVSSIAGLVIIPFYIIMLVQVFHNIDTLEGPQFTSGMQWSVIIFFTVYYTVSIILNMLPNVAIAFQYFNLVELKEARGLISQFENIGQQDPTSSSEEQY